VHDGIFINQRYREIVKTPKWFHSVMSSVAMFTQSKHPSNLKRIQLILKLYGLTIKLDGFMRTLAWTFDYIRRS